MQAGTNPSADPFLRAGVEIQVEIRFSDTDMMQIVHHAAYLPWMELGRLAYMRARGAPYAEIARSHHFAVVAVNLHIRRPLVFGGHVRVATTLESLGTRKLRFAYRMRAEAADAVAATGCTEHICVDLEGRAARIPPGLAARLRGAQPRPGASPTAAGPGENAGGDDVLVYCPERMQS